jgi:probable HAF family extracellular repeat protein
MIVEVPASCTSLGPTRINPDGVVAGFQAPTSAAHTGTNDPFVARVYRNNRLTALGTLGGFETDVVGINRAGAIVGASTTAEGNEHAVLIVNGQLQDLGTLGGDQSFASSINSFGDVVGSSIVPTGESHAFIFRNGKLSDLNNTIGGAALASEGQARYLSQASGIDDRGDILLAVEPQGAPIGAQARSFLYTQGAYVDLDRLAAPGHVVRLHSLNGKGDFTGTLATRSGADHAFLYSAGKLTDLETLAGGSSGGEAVNDKDEVVGSSGSSSERNFGRAFLWKNGKMQDLNNLVDPRDRVVGGRTYSLTRATDINDGGQIVGTARYDAGKGGCHVDLWGTLSGDAGTAGFVLTPLKSN